MQILVRGKHIDVTPGLRTHVEEKISKLERYLDRIQTVEVTLDCQKNWHQTEINLHSDLVELRAQERSLDMYESIDLATKKTERQARRFKERLKHHTQEPKVKELAAELAAAGLLENQRRENGDQEPVEEEARVVRTKQINLKPVSPEEAADQMELVGHDFFVFLNSETDMVNVLYIRNDGNYGLDSAQHLNTELRGFLLKDLAADLESKSFRSYRRF